MNHLDYQILQKQGISVPYYYQAYHLTFQSELKFLELLPVHRLDKTPADVCVQFGDVSPSGLSSPRKKAVAYQANVNEFWLNVPKIARFLVTHGRTITIDPVKGVDEDSIRVFLLGSCIGALLMQRGFHVLHGNVVHFKDFVCAFTGLTGAGKSTLAAAFFKKGYGLLADDICAVNTNLEVIPSFPQMKLWADAAAALEIDVTSMQKIRPMIEKYAIPLEKQFFNQKTLLKAVYILNSHNKDDIIFQRLSGFAKIRPLQLQSYRNYFLDGLGLERQHRLQCARLASQISLTRITRPDVGYSMDKLITLIEQDLLEKEYPPKNTILY